MGPNICKLIVRCDSKLVYPTIYRPIMGSRGIFFFFSFFCSFFFIFFKFSSGVKSTPIFGPILFYWFGVFTKKKPSNYGSPVCRGQAQSPPSTVSTNQFRLFSLPLPPSVPSLHFLVLPSIPCHAFPCRTTSALPCLTLSCLVFTCLVLYCLVFSFLV